MKRNKHSLSHYKLTTCDMGQLVPVGCQEVLPGDTFNHQTSALIRVSPQQAPVMHPVSVRLHHFFVPNRLIWDGWEDFITGGPDGLGPEDDFPTVEVSGDTNAQLLDYLGVPPDAVGLEVSALPVRAYNMIYNEYYRDQDLKDPVPQSSQAVQRVNWEKDYFSASRPWTQKGPAVGLPVGTRAPVKGIGSVNQVYPLPNQDVYETGGAGTTHYDNAVDLDSGGTEFRVLEDPENPGYPGMYADLSSTDSIKINDFRLAFALQRYQEARARFGSRFVEYLRYLGVRPSDARLQRPEYLGGGKQTISFSEVLQTANDEVDSVGTLRGHGIAALRSNRYRRFFEEHGHVITLMSVRPKAIYMNAAHRLWTRRTKEDFWQKELEQIGQQEVLNKEIFANSSAGDDGVFGYCDRYREYREHPSMVSGEFRDILDYWHFGRDFESQPVLSDQFVRCVPTKRVFSEQTQDSLWVMVNHSLQARRMVRKAANSRII